MASSQDEKRLNYLDGKTWTKYSISIWEITKTPEEAKLKHPAMFPVKLCERLIEIYTKVGDVVLDPFMGSGSVLVAAKRLARKGIGFDVVEEFVNLAKERLSKETIRFLPRKYRPLELYLSNEDNKMIIDQNLSRNILAEKDLEPEVYCEDARNLSKYVKPESVDLCITSPPYWGVHRRERTADYKQPRPYSELKEDLGNIPDYQDFLKELSKVFKQVHTVLKPNKRCVVIVMDIRVGSDFIPFHIDVINMMKNINFLLEDIIIWDRRAEYSNLRPLGYPYVFIVNKVHEYILIFRKVNN